MGGRGGETLKFAEMNVIALECETAWVIIGYSYNFASS